MPDTKTPDGKTLSVGSKTLSLKPRTETGVVRQSFSHGRSKQVVVEVKKRRTPAPRRRLPKLRRRRRSRPRRSAAPKPAAAAPAPAAPAPKPSGVVLRTLTDEERNRRAHALGDARLREAEERKIAEEEARHRAIRESSERAEREAAESRKREEDDRHKREEESKRKAGEVAKKRFGEAETTPWPDFRRTPRDRGRGRRRTADVPPRPGWRCRPSRAAAEAADPRRADRRESPGTAHSRHRAQRRRSARALRRLVPPPQPPRGCAISAMSRKRS